MFPVAAETVGMNALRAAARLMSGVATVGKAMKLNPDAPRMVSRAVATRMHVRLAILPSTPLDIHVARHDPGTHSSGCDHLPVLPIRVVMFSRETCGSCLQRSRRGTPAGMARLARWLLSSEYEDDFGFRRDGLQAIVSECPGRDHCLVLGMAWGRSPSNDVTEVKLNRNQRWMFGENTLFLIPSSVSRSIINFRKETL